MNNYQHWSDMLLWILCAVSNTLCKSIGLYFTLIWIPTGNYGRIVWARWKHSNIQWSHTTIYSFPLNSLKLDETFICSIVCRVSIWEPMIVLYIDTKGITSMKLLLHIFLIQKRLCYSRSTDSPILKIPFILYLYF